MKQKKKPDFLKSFSEFTIAELRSMPFHRVFGLFFKEVKSTFTDGSGVKRQTVKKSVKKKVEKNILVKKLQPSQGLTDAVRRIFTIRPSASSPKVSPKPVMKKEKLTQEEVINDVVAKAFTKMPKSAQEKRDTPFLKSSAPDDENVVFSSHANGQN